MAEEGLSPSQKLALATNFVLNSPPAQTINVLDGSPCRQQTSPASSLAGPGLILLPALAPALVCLNHAARAVHVQTCAPLLEGMC